MARKISDPGPLWAETRPATFSDFDTSESDRQLGHEIQKKYPDMADHQIAQALINDKGLGSDSIRINANGVVPGYVPKSAFQATPEVYGVTYNKGAGYPASSPNHTIVLDPENISYSPDPGAKKLATLDHELQHVQDMDNHPDFKSPVAGESPVGQHFYGQDANNRLMPWAGQEALGMMVDRLNSANQSPQGNPPEAFADGGDVPSFEETAPVTGQAPIAQPSIHVAPTPQNIPQPQASHAEDAPPSFDDMLSVDKYNSPTQQLLAGAEGVSRGLFGPFATLGEKAIFQNGPEMAAREENYPGTQLLGEAVGLIGPAVVTGGLSLGARLGVDALAPAAKAIAAASKFTQAGFLENIAQRGASALGLGLEGSGLVSKIGSAAVKGAIENAGFQAGDEVSKQILNPNLSFDAVQSAVWNTGGAALLGSVVGGAFGTIPALWKAQYEKQTGTILHAIVGKVGGIEGILPEQIGMMIDTLGMDSKMPPEVKAALSNDPAIQLRASILNQSDTTSSGMAFQQAMADFKNELDKKMVSALGRDIREISPEFSEAQAGSRVGGTLAKEYAEKMQPISDSFEKAKNLYSDAELGPSRAEKITQQAEIQHSLESELDEARRNHFDSLAKGEFQTAADHESLVSALQEHLDNVKRFSPALGIKDMLLQDLGNMVHQESWAGSDEIMKEVNRVVKRIPEMETIGDLQREMTTIGNNTASKLPYGMNDPVSRAGGMIKSALRDAEISAIGSRIGSEEGEDALRLFNKNREDFKAVAKLRDDLNDRLKIGTSPTGYAKGIKAMAQTDSETLYRRLKGVGDADILRVLSEHFPGTASELRKAHIEKILADSAKAKRGADEYISSRKLVAGLGNMSPELKQFVLAERPGSDQLVRFADILKDHAQDLKQNFSNTARTMDKLGQFIPGGALGLVTYLISKNPIGSLIAGALVKPITKDAPDAFRLATLKFLGSNKPVNSAGFKAAMEFVHDVIKGQSLGMKAATGAIKGVGQVGSSAVIPQVTKESKMKLDEAAKAVKEAPAKLFHKGENTSYYMPEHGQAIAQTASQVANYLNAIRPEPKQLSPLGRPVEPGVDQLAEYQRALGIAQQPLSLFSKVKDGSLMPQDLVHLKALYPAGYQQMAQNLNSAIMDHLSDGGSIPYYTKQAAALFMGEPLDSSMMQPNIASIMMANAPKAQTPVQGASRPKKTSKSAEAANKMYATQNQAREARRLTQS